MFGRYGFASSTGSSRCLMASVGLWPRLNLQDLRHYYRLLRPQAFGRVSIPPTANVPCTPHGAPADFASDVAFGDSGYANTINSCPTRSASEGDLRGHAVRLMKRR